jgi:amino acid transporter
MIYAMAADGLLPRRLAAVHPRFRTPAAAICLHNGACALASLAGSFESLARLSASVTLLSYLGSAAALLVLRRRAAGAAGPGFRIAGGALVPAAACLVTGALLLTVSVAELRTFAGVAALATVLYFVGRRSDRRTGVTRGT